jgi:hypothetical protein
LKKIESESKSITEGHNNRRLSYLKHVSLQPLDKAQLEKQRHEMISNLQALQLQE